MWSVRPTVGKHSRTALSPATWKKIARETETVRQTEKLCSASTYTEITKEEPHFEQADLVTLRVKIQNKLSVPEIRLNGKLMQE